MKNKHFILTAIAFGLLTSLSQAVGIIGIGTDNSLYQFDSATPGVVTLIGTAGGAANLVDIDIHGANGLLYGVTGTGSCFTVDTLSGNQSLVTTPLTALSGLTAIDFNPLADRIRLVGTANANARITPDFQTGPNALQQSGTVNNDTSFSLFQSGGMIARSGATVLGAGYTNPVNNPATTVLYTLASDGFLNMHTTSSGALAGSFDKGVAVGTAGLDFTPVGASFDISNASQGGFGYAFDGTDLRQIDLATGTSISLGPVGVSIRSLAVIPESSNLLLGAVGILGLLRRTRRA